MVFWSQKDLFEDSDESSNKRNKKRMSSTYDPSVRNHDYDGCVLFQWEVDLEFPFSVHKLSDFTQKDIKPEWIIKNLGIASRVFKLRKLTPFPGNVVSLFAKIETGMSIFMYMVAITYTRFIIIFIDLLSRV